MPKKIKYKYIHFWKDPECVDGSIWCLNNKTKERLGWLAYYKPWKQWCFYPQPATVFSQDCLEDIIDFMKGLAEEG